MEKDANLKLTTLAVDGGACENNFLMQFQADVLNCNVSRPNMIESTALGAALLAGYKNDFLLKMMKTVDTYLLQTHSIKLIRR